ncbi:MAG: hypothetical protein VXA52_04540 [Synechococcus sp.]|jgi:hypothetical protein
MGPHLSNSIVVTVGVRANSEPGESRRLRVPFARLNQTMQMLHAHGIAVLAVGDAAVQPLKQADAPAAEATKPAAKPAAAKRTSSRRTRKTA